MTISTALEPGQNAREPAATTGDLTVPDLAEVSSARARPGGPQTRGGHHLLASAKHHSEHEYGIRSLGAALEPFCSHLEVPAEPSVLHLPNVTHLATDVRGRLAADTPLLDLTATVHPAAAVAGTPTPTALRLIRDTRSCPSGRYASLRVIRNRPAAGAVRAGRASNPVDGARRSRSHGRGGDRGGQPARRGEDVPAGRHGRRGHRAGPADRAAAAALLRGVGERTGPPGSQPASSISAGSASSGR
jgi:chorismate binding enzyme